MSIKRIFIIISGPTGVGKTDVALELAQKLNGAIVNGDMGQLYTPLTIGTAKPDWRQETIPHYLFDVIDNPERCSAAHYRTLLLQSLEAIWQNNQIPFIVGGSHFYLQSVLFPPAAVSDVKELKDISESGSIWHELYAIDPDRANKLHPKDTYRIKRALAIWQSTGRKPSSFESIYSPPSPYYLFCLTRAREELYQRINVRVKQMIDRGWIDEVHALVSTPWYEFLLEKKIIGYDDIIRFLKIGHPMQSDYDQLIEVIAQKTRNYAKRQLTYCRTLEKRLTEVAEQNLKPKPLFATLNLTLLPHDLYIKQLSTLILKEIE